MLTMIKLPSRRIIGLVIAAALVVGLVGWYVARPAKRSITAYFTSAASLYPGNPVEVLGVKVGEVSSVDPEPGQVKVVLTLDGDTLIPDGVHAFQVSPSLISGRSVTLSPVYRGGPTLSNHAVIPVARTQVPLDVNDLYSSAQSLAKALGPRGANKQGSLSRFFDVLASNLKGNGAPIAAAIRNLGDATTTLASSSPNLTGTVRGLQQFVTTLAHHDGGMRRLNVLLGQVTGSLAADRGNLGGAIRQLSLTLGTVARFVQDNRSVIRSSVDRLSRVSQVLVRERRVLGEVLDEAPTGLGNLLNAYNASGGTLDVRIDVNELQQAPGALLCTLIDRGSPAQLPQSLIDACKDFIGNLGKGIPSIADLLSIFQGNPPGGTSTGSTKGSRR
jgi:virulence factor Mce-like protein